MPADASLASVVNACKKTGKIPNTFFQVLLTPYFESSKGLDKRVGDFLYRLSDFVPQENRKQIVVWPVFRVSLDVKKVQTLEDWRELWEKQYHPSSVPHISFENDFTDEDLNFLSDL